MKLNRAIITSPKNNYENSQSVCNSKCKFSSIGKFKTGANEMEAYKSDGGSCNYKTALWWWPDLCHASNGRNAYAVLGTDWILDWGLRRFVFLIVFWILSDLACILFAWFDWKMELHRLVLETQIEETKLNWWKITQHKCIKLNSVTFLTSLGTIGNYLFILN